MGEARRGPTMLDDGSDVTARLSALDPSFGAALQKLGGIVDGDGALPRSDKDLLGVAMAAVSDPSRCHGATERAVGSGIAVELFSALAMALYLSRGERPAGHVLDAVDRVIGSAPASLATSGRSDADVGIEEIIGEFAAVFGELPARVTLLAEHAPAGLQAYHRMRVAVLRDGALPPRLGELVLFAVNAAEHRDDYAAVHARGARRAGVDEAQLVEAGLCTIPYGGVAAWLAASEAIVASRSDSVATPDDGRA